MDAAKVKEVIVSDQFDLDIAEVFEYGEKTFGHSSAKAFVSEIYTLIRSLDVNYLSFPENRFLVTRNKSYRNIIIGSYLVIYKVEEVSVKVLRIVRSEVSIRQVRSVKRVR